MKNKIAILGCLTIVAVGVWYLLKEKKMQELDPAEPVGPIMAHKLIQEPDSVNNPLPDIWNDAKELVI